MNLPRVRWWYALPGLLAACDSGGPASLENPGDAGGVDGAGGAGATATGCPTPRPPSDLGAFAALHASFGVSRWRSKETDPWLVMAGAVLYLDGPQTGLQRALNYDESARFYLDGQAAVFYCSTAHDKPPCTNTVAVLDGPDRCYRMEVHRQGQVFAFEARPRTVTLDSPKAGETMPLGPSVEVKWSPPLDPKYVRITMVLTPLPGQSLSARCESRYNAAEIGASSARFQLVAPPPGDALPATCEAQVHLEYGGHPEPVAGHPTWTFGRSADAWQSFRLAPP
jgi:hypothetical protein